uniref:Uncharacterized protein n=1 Tax=Cannabis sativa TaxID=3483 RepID=A0A803PMM1_CANSA
MLVMKMKRHESAVTLDKFSKLCFDSSTNLSDMINRQDPSGILDDGRASSASNEDVAMANKDEGGGDGEHHGKEKRRKLMVEELREETMSSCSSSETDKVDDLNLKQCMY